MAVAVCCVPTKYDTYQTGSHVKFLVRFPV
jgi:hypothetical protein